MKEKIIKDIKTELCRIKDYSEIGEILYDNSIRIEHFNDLIPALEEVKKFFKDVSERIELFIDTCRKDYKEKYGYNFKDIDEAHDDNTIVGRGSIEIMRDDNKLKIVLDCE